MRELPLTKLKMLNTAMARVVVLIPPPVDFGEAPTHIRKNSKRVVGKRSEAVSTVLNPAVRGVTAPKNAVISFPEPLWRTRVLLN